jgi:LPXTG-motif cell wall-anchored protein
LREAKLDYMKVASGLASHPAFWSPFIQLGDSRAIRVRTIDENNWIWGLLGGILLIGLVVIVGRKRKKRLDIIQLID